MAPTHFPFLPWANGLKERAQGIKALLFDVDGVLTNGSISYTDAGQELKTFFVRDGQIVRYLRQAGLKTGAITGRKSAITQRRAQELKLDFCYQGIGQKLEVFQSIAAELNLDLAQMAYIGDDIIDVPVLKVAGLAASPADAPFYVQQQAHYVTAMPGGRGVLREVAELILCARGLENNFMQGL